MYKYLTIQETLMQNAIRHKMRMEKYLLLGMYRHAMGSFRKYQKNYDKSEYFNKSGFGHYTLWHVLADGVANAILRGD